MMTASVKRTQSVCKPVRAVLMAVSLHRARESVVVVGGSVLCSSLARVYPDQLDVEVEVRVGRDGIPRPVRAVAQGARHMENRALSQGHLQQSLVPALDDLSF